MAFRTLILLLISLALCQGGLACTDPVLRARQGHTSAVRPPLHSIPPTPLPKDLDLRPEAQVCKEDRDCFLARGLPGQNQENLCCATCQSRTLALRESNYERLQTWKQGLRCETFACGLVTGCGEEKRPVLATCNLGLCVVE